MRYILVPCFVKYNVAKEAARTFNDGQFEIIQLVTTMITDYSGVQPFVVEQEVRDRIRMLKRSFTDDDEIYMVTSGSAFHNALVSKILIEEGVPFRFLIFEKKIGRYAIV